MNKFITKGRLTKDPEFKTLQSGTEISNFSIAVDRKFKRDGQPTADFFNCIAFSKTASFIDNFFSKGKEILIEGSIQNRSWNDAEGNKRYATDVIVDNVYFCGSKSDNATSQASDNRHTEYQTAYAEIEDDVDSDDLPF